MYYAHNMHTMKAVGNIINYQLLRALFEVQHVDCLCFSGEELAWQAPTFSFLPLPDLFLEREVHNYFNQQ